MTSGVGTSLNVNQPWGDQLIGRGGWGTREGRHGQEQCELWSLPDSKEVM